jgi:hypothetical protein
MYWWERKLTAGLTLMECPEAIENILGLFSAHEIRASFAVGLIFSGDGSGVFPGKVI